MIKRFNSFLVLFLTLLLSGCVTKKVREGIVQNAQWETKAIIHNQKENKSQSLAIDIYAVKEERARFEITALLGFQVASVVMSPSEISYAIYPRKSFYYGRNSETAFSRLIDLPLHPMNLANIAFDEPVRGQGWKCSLDTMGTISQCENSQRQIRVSWLERNQGQKKVHIVAPQFEMRWQFSAPQTEVQFKSELFTLKQPSGFKAIQIN